MQMTSNMKRILINWYYEREDLTKHLLELSSETQIVFIGKHFKPIQDERQKFSEKNLSIIYWEQYHSPYQILDEIQPDLIIFHDIEAYNQMALNIAAKNNGIKTCVLQHGLRGEYEVADALKQSPKNNMTKLSHTSWWTLKFLIRSIRWKNINDLIPLFKFVIDRKRSELTVALYKNQFELRRADFYIEFSRANATYHKVRDGIPDNRFFLVGNPNYDDFYNRIKQIPSGPIMIRYALLIDSPFCEANFVQKERMSQEEKNDYIKRLNEYCIQKNLRLYIKLHPLSYSSSSLFKDENIIYFREADIVELVGKSQLVFLLHFSTLAPIVLSLKPFIFFCNKYISQSDLLSSLSIAAYDLLDFKPEELVNAQPQPPLTTEILRDYLFISDGRAKERIKQLILHS